MLLVKDGITVEVSHPADIRRFKGMGYVEEKPVEKKVAKSTEKPDDAKKDGK